MTVCLEHTSQGKQQEMRFSPNLTPGALQRAKLADNWFYTLNQFYRRNIRAMWQEAQDWLELGIINAIDQGMQDRWARTLFENSKRIVPKVVLAGVSLASEDMIAAISGKQFMGFGPETEGLGFLEEQQIDAWLRVTSDQISRTTRKKIHKAHKFAQEFWDPEKKRGMTRAQLEKFYEIEGVADSRERARLLAHTVSQWAITKERCSLIRGSASRSWSGKSQTMI